MANAWIIPPVGFTASSPNTALGVPGNLALDYAGIIWRSTVTGLPYLRIDLGADTVIDTIAIFGLAGGIATATLQIYGSTAAEGAAARARASGTMPLLAGSEMPTSGLGVALAALPAWPAVRYIDIEFGLAASYIQVSRVVIAKRFAPERNFSYGGTIGVRDLGSLDFSPRGVIIRRRAKKLRTASITFSALYRDEVEGITQPLLERIGNTEMIALFSDPSEDPMRQRRGFFGNLVGDLSQARRNAVGWETKVNIVSIF
jgi:hypothetical protein